VPLSISFVPPKAPADPKTKLSNTDNETKISKYHRANIQYSFLDDRPAKSFQRRITVKKSVITYLTISLRGVFA
jgi:hypothetical protein